VDKNNLLYNNNDYIADKSIKSKVEEKFTCGGGGSDEPAI
jgi:hypothetical protein